TVRGLEFPPVDFRPEEVVCPSLFARAIRSSWVPYLSTEGAERAGFAGRVSPPLSFFHVVDAATIRQRLGIDWGRTLAAGETAEYGVRVTERDLVRGSVRVSDAYRRIGSDGDAREFLFLQSIFTLVTTGDLISRSTVCFIEKYVE
ncbi:FAS1-like dehydratase domain-containing protein, partial [Nocardia rhamnosiphila]